MISIARIPLALLALLVPAAASAAITFTVNSAADEADSNPLDGVCKTASNVCTLRAAIQQANQNGPGSGLHSIQFNFGGASTTISPASPLPTITSIVAIDGYANLSGTANTLVSGNDAALKVRLDGANAGIDTSGLSFGPGSSGSSVGGLIIIRFRVHGIMATTQVGTISHLTIAGNFIGTDGSGSMADANGDLRNWASAVVLGNNVQDSMIGGALASSRNLLTSYSTAGALTGISIGTVAVWGGSIRNTVRNNYIGTNRTGNVFRPNGVGIYLGSADDSLIDHNVITGSYAGVFVAGQARRNSIKGNFIGVGANGSAAITDNTANAHGVWISNAAFGVPQHTLVGGALAGEGNVIARWSGNGIRVERTPANTAPAYSRWLGNSIHDNGALGVELIDAAFPESADPARPQPPWGLDFPLISGATGNGSGTQVNYAMHAQPNAQYRVEAFANTSCDPTNFGEGQFVLGFATISTDSAGQYAGTLDNLTPLPFGQDYVTMTATSVEGISGRSSEFSQCVRVSKNGSAGTPPTVASGSASRPVNQPLSLNLAAYVTAPADAPVLFYALAGGPDVPGLQLDPSTGVLSGTPGSPGTYKLALTAANQDGAAWPAAVFTLTITPVDGGGGDGGSGGNVTTVPTLDHLGLVLLGLLLAGVGGRAKSVNRAEP